MIIAVPNKGRLSEPSVEILREAGIRVEGKERKLITSTNNPRINVLFARARDIPHYVDTNSAQVGITGYDMVLEAGVDVDVLCVHMCYIQLTLLHISAEVVHGNSLTNEVFNVWYTPAYIMGAASRQVPNLEECEEEIKVTLPDDGIKDKVLYNKDELEVFATGRLFV